MITGVEYLFMYLLTFVCVCLQKNACLCFLFILKLDCVFVFPVELYELSTTVDLQY